MESINEMWTKFNDYSNRLAEELGRTSNIVGEYAEYLACQYYEGKHLKISGASADVEDRDGHLYQIKSRKIKKGMTTQLNVIRSWEFDYLVVILFGESGQVQKAIEVPVRIAREYAVENSHQNGFIITTTQKFLNDEHCKDITDPLKKQQTL
ncbi:MAG: hypothetical protein AB7E49_11150 [Campylobacterales bacterium]